MSNGSFNSRLYIRLSNPRWLGFVLFVAVLAGVWRLWYLDSSLVSNSDSQRIVGRWLNEKSGASSLENGEEFIEFRADSTYVDHRTLGLPFPSGLWELTIDGEIRFSPDMESRVQSKNRLIRFQITHLNVDHMVLLRTITDSIPTDTIERDAQVRVNELGSTKSEVFVLTREGM